MSHHELSCLLFELVVLRTLYNTSISVCKKSSHSCPRALNHSESNSARLLGGRPRNGRDISGGRGGKPEENLPEKPNSVGIVSFAKRYLALQHSFEFVNVHRLQLALRTRKNIIGIESIQYHDHVCSCSFF